MRCPNCNSEVVQAVDANTAEPLLLDEEAVPGGEISLTGCCPGHEPIARTIPPVIPGALGYQLHEHQPTSSQP